MTAKEFAEANVGRVFSSQYATGRVIGYELEDDLVCIETDAEMAVCRKPRYDVKILTSLMPDRKYWHTAVKNLRLVDDAPKPAQTIGKSYGFTPPPCAKHVDFQPLAGIEDAAGPLVMAMEETLAHLHTVSAYVRNEKQFSATHAAVTRRLAQALREHKGGK